MQKYISSQTIETILRIHGEISFKKIESDSHRENSINIENAVPEYEFRIIRDKYSQFYLDNFEWYEPQKFEIKEKNSDIIYVNHKVAKRCEGAKCELNTPSFIYDSPNAPSFVLSFDPIHSDAWFLNFQNGCSIVAENLTHEFLKRDGSVLGLNNINFNIQPGEFVGIYGGSGTGKTLLLEKILAPEYHSKNWFGKILTHIKNKIITPTKNVIKWYIRKKKIITSGKVLINNKEPWKIINKIAYLPQNIDFPLRMTCKEILELALIDRCGNNFPKEIGEIQKLCSIEDALLDRKYKSLSGGQKRRLALAVALLKKDTKLLIADEPTTGLDICTEEEIMNTLKRISRHGITVITVTHSLATCRKFDRVLVLRKMGIQEGTNISFDGLWQEHNLANSSNLRDDEILRRLTLSSSIETIKKKKEYSFWPLKTTSQSADKISIFSFFFSYYNIVFFQIIYWSKTIFKLVYRDIKSLIIFVILAFISVVIVQIGVGSVDDSEILLLCLLSLISPWLCATYSSLLTSSLVKYFAWENFSGLKALGFVLGNFFGQTLAVLLLSVIFSLGIFISPENKTIVAKIFSIPIQTFTKNNSDLKEENKSNHFDKIYELIKIANGDTEKEHKNLVDENIEITAQNSCVKFPIIKLLEAVVKGNYTSREIEGQRKLIDKYKIFYSKEKSIRINILLKILFVMLIVSFSGTALGICATSIFRKSQRAALALVVLFIFFLCYSRLFIVKPAATAYLTSFEHLKICEASRLSFSDIGILLPIFLSFASISRYSIQLIISIFFKFAQIDFAIISIFFIVLPLLLATFLFSNKTINWRFLSR